MALKGFLVPSNYSVVTIRSYNKTDRTMQLSVKTYQDNTKRKELNELTYHFHVETGIDCVDQDITELPNPLIAGDKYIIGENASVPLSDHAGLVLVCPKNGDWGIMTPAPGTVAHILSTGSWFEWDGEAWLATTSGPTESSWDAYFSISTLEEAGMNELRAAYLYLKSLPEWQHTTDI